MTSTMGICVPDDLEAGIQKSGYQHGLFLGRAPSWLANGHLFPMCSPGLSLVCVEHKRQRRGVSSLFPLFYRTTSPIELEPHLYFLICPLLFKRPLSKSCGEPNLQHAYVKGTQFSREHNACADNKHLLSSFFSLGLRHQTTYPCP